MPLYAAVVMKGGAVFIEQMFHIDLHLALLIFTLIVAAYVITGGIKGVLLYGCVASGYHVRLYAIPAIFGFTISWTWALSRGKPEVDGYRPHGARTLQGLGTSGWTAMPISGSPQWYTLVTCDHLAWNRLLGLQPTAIQPSDLATICLPGRSPTLVRPISEGKGSPWR